MFLEAWRTVDRAYIDKTFNGQNWFKYRENALKNAPMNDRDETCERPLNVNVRLWLPHCVAAVTSSCRGRCSPRTGARRPHPNPPEPGMAVHT